MRLRVEVLTAPEGILRPTYESLLRRALALVDTKVTEGEEDGRENRTSPRGK